MTRLSAGIRIPAAASLVEVAVMAFSRGLEVVASETRRPSKGSSPEPWAMLKKPSNRFYKGLPCEAVRLCKRNFNHHCSYSICSSLPIFQKLPISSCQVRRHSARAEPEPEGFKDYKNNAGGEKADIWQRPLILRI